MLLKQKVMFISRDERTEILTAFNLVGISVYAARYVGDGLYRKRRLMRGFVSLAAQAIMWASRLTNDIICTNEFF